MALVKALQGEVRVLDGINYFTIGTEPSEIPDAFLPAALEAGAVEVRQTKPASKTPPKQPQADM
jgi:hypothetical protein